MCGDKEGRQGRCTQHTLPSMHVQKLSYTQTYTHIHPGNASLSKMLYHHKVVLPVDCTHIHTYIPTYLHTYIHTYIHTHLHPDNVSLSEVLYHRKGVLPVDCAVIRPCFLCLEEMPLFLGMPVDLCECVHLCVCMLKSMHT